MEVMAFTTHNVQLCLPTCAPTGPKEKQLILKILTHPNSGFGWLVSLMCCQISSPVISAIMWDKSTVTGHWILKDTQKSAQLQRKFPGDLSETEAETQRALRFWLNEKFLI